jgi:phosphotransferase system HPr (HPr) family protein
MLESIVTVILTEGLHARPAAEFVKLASSYSSTIKLGKNDKFIDAKSILGLMSLAVSKGQEVTLQISGSDEEEAMTELEKFLTEKVD